MITRYDFMQDSDQGDGISYPNCLTLPLDKFRRVESTDQVVVREEDYYRPDLMFARLQGSNDMEDIILWLNHKDSRRNTYPGTTLNLPSPKDLDLFYIEQRI